MAYYTTPLLDNGDRLSEAKHSTTYVTDVAVTYISLYAGVGMIITR